MAASSQDPAQRVTVLDLPASWKPDVSAQPDPASRYNAIIESIKESQFLEERDLDILRKDRNKSILDLTGQLKKYRKENLEIALNFAAVLDELDSPAGREFALRCLAEGNSTDRKKVFFHLDFWKEKKPAPAKPESELYHKLLEDSDPQVRAQSAELLLSEPGIDSVILKLVRDPGVPRRGQLAARFAQKNPQKSTALQLVDLARKALAQPSEKDASEWLQVIAACCSNPDPEVSLPALQALDAEFKALPESMRYNQQIIRTVRDNLSTASMPVLEDIIYQAKDPVSKGYALQAEARLDGEQALPRLLRSLDAPYLRPYCLKGLAFVIRDENRPAILQELSKNYSKVPPSQNELRFLLEQRGDKGRELAKTQLPKLKPEDRMLLMWHLNRWKLEDLAAALKENGLIRDVPSAQQFKIFRAKWEKEYEGREMNEIDLVPKFLEELKLLISFDSETDELPVRHDLLILKMAAISQDSLSPGGASQKWLQKDKKDTEAGYLVEFSSGTKLIRFEAENLGDWYDLPVVQAALNRALEEKKAPGRYLLLDYADQVAYFVFGPPAAWQKIQAQYFLPLNNEAGKPMETGKDFEDKALKYLRDSEIIQQ